MAKDITQQQIDALVAKGQQRGLSQQDIVNGLKAKGYSIPQTSQQNTGDTFKASYLGRNPEAQQVGLNKMAKAGEFLGMKPVADIFAKGIQSSSALASLIGGNKEGFNRKMQIAEQVDDPTAKQVMGSILSTALLAAGGPATKGVETLAARAIPAITKAPGLLPGLARFGARVAPRVASGATLGGTQSGSIAAAQGKSNEEIRSAIIAGGLISGAVPIGLEGGKVVLRQGAKGLANIFGIGSGGLGGKGIQEIGRRAEAGDLKTVQEFRRGKSGSAEIIEQSKRAVSKMYQAKEDIMQREMEALTRGVDVKVDLKPLKEVVKDKALKGYGVKLGKEGLDFSASGVSKSGGTREVMEEVYDTVNNWDDFSVSGVNRLHQQLNDISKAAFSNKRGATFAGNIAEALSDIIEEAAPGYKAKNIKYGNMANAINMANEVFGLKKTKALGSLNPVTAINKLMSVFKDSKELQLQMLNELSQQSGVDLTGMVVGAQARPFLPASGVGRAALGVGAASSIPTAIATGVTGGQAATVVGGTALASSPRILSGIAMKAGQVNRLMKLAEQQPQFRSIIAQLLGATVQQQSNQ